MSEIEQTTAEIGQVSEFVLKKTIVMVGMMGAGKTAVGRALAQLLSVPFLDSDHEIEAAANMTVPEIFARDGETFFRARETEVIYRLLKGHPCVLSTGGGAFLSSVNRTAISEHGVSVWLKADIDLLWNRVKHRDTRPLLRTADPKATLTELFQKRGPAYAQADIEVPCAPPVTIEKMALRVANMLLTRPDVLEINHV